ncbi:hypothetical protein C2G38_2145155 [Gigaspora rosea]|uniref:Uncharacterized protein n=1 Tax=Gigaspora rosea TaxID=44941 RepID=A0A397USE2_9GLOM|nr:hypothetical protein C2G38_2145155 [Gigaspora rosea]
MTEISTTARRQNHVTEILPELSTFTKPQISNSSVRTKILPEAKVSILPVSHPEKALLETVINASSASQPKKDLLKAERLPISVLPDDPEEKRNHIIKMVSEQFPYLTLKYSNEYGDYFSCPKTCLVCNKEHKRDDVKGEWSG